LAACVYMNVFYGDQARRNRLLAMRRDGVIGDEAFHRIEEELDLAELALTGRRGSLLRAQER